MLVASGIGGGLVAATYLTKTRFNTRIEAMDLKIPSFAGVKFVVNSEHRMTAWRFFVQMSTRVSTQPLEAGDSRKALDSLHDLFQLVRNRLDEMGPSPTSKGASVELLAIWMLNAELRPFLSKWHPLLDDYEAHSASGGSAGWERDDEFRAELEVLRRRLRQYVRGFGKLSGVADLDTFFPVDESPTQPELEGVVGK